jgi:hypothetical protein
VVGVKNETTQRVTTGGEKDNETVAVTYNADGLLLPPFVISSGINLAKLPPEDEDLRVWRAASPKGWMDGISMLNFLKLFRKELVEMELLVDNSSEKKVIFYVT